MFQWFSKLLGYFRDPVLDILKSTNIFFTVNNKNDRFGKNYCGFNKIAYFCTVLEGSKNNLKLFLRVYRSSKDPYRYIFVYSFGDNVVKDFIFNSQYTTRSPFTINELANALEDVINTAVSVQTLHSVKNRVQIKVTN